jgi:putative addiction module killer protein
MISIKPLPEFTEWLDGLSDVSVRGVVLARIKRLALGLMGDVGPVGPVGEGVSELRIHIGAGWRIYFIQRRTEVIVLLGGGTKRTQKTDIKHAKNLASRLD